MLTYNSDSVVSKDGTGRGRESRDGMVHIEANRSSSSQQITQGIEPMMTKDDLTTLNSMLQ